MHAGSILWSYNKVVQIFGFKLRLVGQRHFFSHSRAGGSLSLAVQWIPAYAGMTWKQKHWPLPLSVFEKTIIK